MTLVIVIAGHQFAQHGVSIERAGLRAGAAAVGFVGRVRLAEPDVIEIVVFVDGSAIDEFDAVGWVVFDRAEKIALREGEGFAGEDAAEQSVEPAEHVLALIWRQFP